MRLLALLLLLATAAFADDREVAEWVIRWEGLVTVAGSTQPVSDVGQLPPGDLRITAIDPDPVHARAMCERVETHIRNVAEEYIHTGGWAIIHTYAER